MSHHETTYHAMIEDSGEVFVLFRCRHDPDGSMHSEKYLPGEGWVPDNYFAYDLHLNGQDYDLLDEDEAEDLVERMGVEG